MDKETFEVMMSDLQRDPTVPLMLRPQIEYREEVRSLLRILIKSTQTHSIL